MPHLLIVIDEFAELKSRQPEFMSELVSVAQVGRSLGVHLLLSTQKLMNKQGSMVVRGANETITEIFEVTGFCDILTLE
jgi:DNA segregation ATPase FtsK/SpoIIIE-like protein